MHTEERDRHGKPARIVASSTRSTDVEIVISPEFGERVDLMRLTRDLMNRVVAPLGLTAQGAVGDHSWKWAYQSSFYQTCFTKEKNHGAENQLREVSAAQTVESYPTDYRKVNGLMCAYSLDVKIAGQLIFQRQAQQVEINPTIDDSIFKMPSAPVK
jgi:hypothetical protein